MSGNKVCGTAQPCPQKGSVRGEILEVEFLNDHGKLLNSPSNKLTDEGKRYSKIEWQKKNGVNDPVTYTKNTKIKLRVKIKIEPAGNTFKLVGTGGPGCVIFKKNGIQSTGKEEDEEVEASGRLPGRVVQLKHTINWCVTGPAGQANLGASGPHEVFVTWDEPIEKNSLDMTNLLTYERIKLTTAKKVAGGQSKLDIIARKVHTYVNNELKKTWGNPTIDYGSKRGAQFWGLLKEKVHKGMCGEASMLMEMMNRLLGIHVLQKHVHAAETRNDVEEFLVYQGHGDKKPLGEMHKSRWCKIHDDWEYLTFTFGYGLDNLQMGEGCCDVNNKLYAGGVDIVGKRAGSRTAAHDILLKLEKHYMREQRGGVYRKLENPFLPHFQLWIYVKDGSKEVCGFSKPSGPNPFPPVPK